MQKILYTIKGTPLFAKETEQKLLDFLAEFDIDKSLQMKKDGFTLQVEEDKKSLLAFEQNLMTKVITLYDLHSYHKKEQPYETRLFKKGTRSTQDKESYEIASTLLKKVSVIAIKTPHSYHLVCNASKIPALKELRNILQESEKPFCVIFKSLIRAEKLVLLSKKEKELLASPQKPTLLVKLKTLHQLERTTYKYTLNSFINPLNKRIAISLPTDEFYEKLCAKVPFPIVSVEARNKKGDLITTYEELIETFGERFAHVFEEETPIQEPKQREIYQIIYGKVCEAFPICKESESAEITLELTKSDILGYHLQKPPIKYFDTIAKECELYAPSSIASRSLLLAENYFEVCEEDLFDYHIEDKEIVIDLASAPNKTRPKQLFSTLTNTFSQIISEIAAKEQQKKITLCGRIFGYRDLTELTLEKLEEKNIEAVLAHTL